MSHYPLRLKPGQDLKQEILKWAAENKISAAAILTCVGSLKNLHIRLSQAATGTTYSGYFEIVSLVGTFSENAGHFHISVADDKGQVLGGHLLDQNIIHTTAELIFLDLPNYDFARLKDPDTGYQELVITSRLR